MALPFRELVTLLTPPSAYYRRRIAAEARAGEPELAVLDELMRRGGTAVDVGANQGFFAYALSELADRVVAFEPNPDYALFARVMLRGRAEVHRLALADRPGRAAFRVPIDHDGTVLHLAGSLKGTHGQFPRERSYQVEVRTLDSFRLSDVRFIKVDVEGSEREVLDGGAATIARDRPALLLELLSGTHADPGGYTAAICAAFGYDACIVQRGEKIPALPAIAALGTNTSWGSEIESRNVLFLPRI
jgi:FkbM family methyltransferase